jgi:hypothetical protein
MERMVKVQEVILKAMVGSRRQTVKVIGPVSGIAVFCRLAALRQAETLGKHQ